MVKRESLLKSRFQGFVKKEFFDYISIILKEYEFINREVAENDKTYKQIIPYAIIRNSNNDFFVYKRGNKNYNEKRLSDKWSLGVGGHIERIDIPTDHSRNIITESVLREIREEIGISSDFSLDLLGYINDDSNEVGKVHFGIVYLVSLFRTDIEVCQDEIQEFKFSSLEEIKELYEKFETWSKLIYDFLIGENRG